MTHALPLTKLEDRSTRAHEVRVARLSRAIARRLGMSAAEIAMIGRAALVHDIGKIAVPNALLAKGMSLLDQEWELMERHVSAGFDLLSQSGAPIKVALIALQHHERLDGSGYPNHLQGDTVPLESRIVAVADIFDALTSARPYKPAWPEDRVFAELRREERLRLIDTLVRGPLPWQGDEGDRKAEVTGGGVALGRRGPSPPRDRSDRSAAAPPR